MNRAQQRTAKTIRVPMAPKRVAASDLFFTAVRHHQKGRFDQAIAYYDAYLARRPDSVETYYNRGTALKQQGRLDEAIAAFRHAISIDPGDAETHNNLGNALAEQGRSEDAIASYCQAISLRADYAPAHVNLGKALRLAGRRDEAVACLLRAIALQPKLVEAHFALGATLKELGQFRGAVESFLTTLSLKPEYPEALYNLGLTLQVMDRLDEAVSCYRAAIGFKPRFLEAYTNLGAALRLQGKLPDAVASLNLALDINPDAPEPHNNLGVALTELGRIDEAVACFQRSLDLQQRPDAMNNMGIARLIQGHLDEAIDYHHRGLALDPECPDSHFLLGMALLASGDMAAGWPEFEWRWKTSQLRKAWRDFPQPQWYGQATEGRTLLIHAEQGFGDTLQFCRYAPLAAAHGWRVVMEVQRPLLRLMHSLAGVAQLIAAGDPLPAFDSHCAMLSLPLALGTTVETIPGIDAYLQADPTQVAAWRTRLATIAPEGLRVGLVWAGNPRLGLPAAASFDRRRSMDPDHLTPLVSVPDVRFFSLQKDARMVPTDLPLIDVMQEMKDFADTAALIANLDLVISVDTAVAHLASAIGKPVWLLDRFDPCWRWLQGRRDSPWYPKLRIYRQPRPADWSAVVAEVGRDLRELAAAGARTRRERGVPCMRPAWARSPDGRGTGDTNLIIPGLRP